MKNQKKIVCIIPVRLASTRFPRKALASLHGRPMIAWVWDAVQRVDLFDDVFFAVDAQETADVITGFGGKSLMTSVDCQSGTDRLVELVMKGRVEADVLVNWQGDEPFITPAMILSLVQSIDNPNEDIWMLKKLIQDKHDIFSPNVSKVVCNRQGTALYFSRAPIPFFRDESDPAVLVAKKVYYKNVGLYAYTPRALRKIFEMGLSACEDAEKLEMLRWLDYGLSIRLHETDCDVKGIDTPGDLAIAESLMSQRLR